MTNRHILKLLVRVAAGCLVQSAITSVLALSSSIGNSRSSTLITFDVDGTLLHGSGQAAAASAHARAFSHAVGVVLGDGTNSVTPVAEALPRTLYQGSTDGLILLRLARATLGVEPVDAFPRLDEMMDTMYEFMRRLDREEIAAHIAPLPGVLDTLRTLASRQQKEHDVSCGLVTGNVEGIARRKMDVLGIFDTGALSPPCVATQRSRTWQDTEHVAFLGGFGSDFCSGNIDDPDRNHLDRGEQLAIATRRCQNQLRSERQLRRVVQVGDAPADVLAAKSFSERNTDDTLCVGMVAVATGSYPAEELRALIGVPVPGRWEPVVLEDGMTDPTFLQACGLL